MLQQELFICHLLVRKSLVLSGRIICLQHYRQHLKNEVERTAASSDLALQQAAEEEAEHLALMEYNHQENLRVAALREARLVSS